MPQKSEMPDAMNGRSTPDLVSGRFVSAAAAAIVLLCALPHPPRPRAATTRGLA